MTSRRFWELTWTLAVTDWRLRFYGSALGYLWTLARPFAFFGVIYIVFTEVADFGNQVKDYGICILFSMVLFQFFAEATNGSVTAVVRRENLVALTVHGTRNAGGIVDLPHAIEVDRR